MWYMAQSNPSTPSRAGKGVAAYIRCHESGTPPPRRSQSRKSPKLRLGACTFAANSRVDAEVSDEVRRASGSTKQRSRHRPARPTSGFRSVSAASRSRSAGPLLEGRQRRTGAVVRAGTLERATQLSDGGLFAPTAALPWPWPVPAPANQRSRVWRRSRFPHPWRGCGPFASSEPA